MSEIGRDCIGAVQILPDDAEPGSVRQVHCEKIDRIEIAELLRISTSDDIFRTGRPDDFRISLAGAQEKNAFTFHDGSWAVPIGTTPSTHIFKLPIGNIGFADMSTSVENEWLCTQIMKLYGVDTSDCRMEQFAEIKVLVVERFDRRLSGDQSWIMRIPQEDFCQVTGTPAGLKYESDGGPGMKVVSDILLNSSNSIEDREIFFKSHILFWLLAAPDGHAKNFSIFLQPGGGFQLTPLYDIMSAFPVLGNDPGMIYPSKLKMAMAVTGGSRHYHWQKIRLDHWQTTAASCGISKEVLNRIFNEIIDSTPSVIDRVRDLVPAGFPEKVADSILGGLETAVGMLKE